MDRLEPRVAELVLDRGDVWLDVSPVAGRCLDDVARDAGLVPIGRGWVPRTREEAVRLLTVVLHRDLAYRAEQMPEHRARWLAERLVAVVGRCDARFVSNTADFPGADPWGWTPATTATFDTGVVAAGPELAMVCWVADED